MSKPIDIAENFDEFIKDGVVVVDFFATWCGPCRMLAPIMDEVAAKMPQVKFGKVDIDKAPELARRFKIMSIPYVIVFKNGENVDHVIGLCDEDEISALINKHL